MMERIKKLKDLKVDKGWQWLIYFDIILPLIIFVAGYILVNTTLGPTFAKLFHSYNLFLIDPIPEPAKFIGIVGAIMHLGFIGYALKRKDYKDAVLCILLTAMTVIYFILELNYKLILYLNFANL